MMSRDAQHDRLRQPAPSGGEEGFALVLLIVATFLILLFLGIAAPRVARELRREREVEAVHRANQYVRAVQLYYKKFGNYPTSIDQLEKTTNIRFLRQKYVDPMTGKADWRIIHVGENKTTVKGLFGQPLTGLPGGAGLGASSLGGTQTVSGTSTTSSGLTGSSTTGSTMTGTTGGFGSGTSSSGFGTSPTGTSSIGGTGTSSFGGPATTADGSTTSSSGIGSQNATSFKGSGGPIMGFGSSQSGNSIVTVNEQTDYSKWEFLYDPRIEQLKARSSLFGGGGIGSSNAIGGSGTGSTAFGSGSNSNSGTGGSAFGSGSNSNSFGSSSPAGTYGASPGATNGGTTTTPTTPNSPNPQP